MFLCVCAAGSAQTWERVGPEGGNVLSLATAGDGTVFLGTADGHVFASQGGGGRWELRGRVGTRTDAVVQKIVVDVKSRSTLYAAVWTQDPVAGGGVYRSVDGGKTWKRPDCKEKRCARWRSRRAIRKFLWRERGQGISHERRREKLDANFSGAR